MKRASLSLTVCLTALVMASETSAGPLFPGPKFAAGDTPVAVAIADLDADTVPDLVTANSMSGDVSVLLGNGDGTLEPSTAFAVGIETSSVAIADLDGDTVPDLVATNRFSFDVKVLLGNGDGTFQAAAAFVAGDAPSSVAVADLDGDAVPDLVTANRRTNDVSVLLGNGDGTFQAPMAFAAGVDPVSVAVADLDGDAVPDVGTASSGSGSNDVRVLLGTGDGTLQAAAAFAAGDGPGAGSLAVVDLDGDGLLDLATANSQSHDVKVLLNLSGPAAHSPEIDIKPGSDSNPVNPMSMGVIPVAILGSEIFDVVDVDATTLAFGPAGAEPAHPSLGHLEDVNADGFTDLVTHYPTRDSGIAFGDADACVTGRTINGTSLEACDTILIVGSCGIGFELVFLLPPLLWMRRWRLSNRSALPLA